jgi:hypothetical protein
MSDIFVVQKNGSEKIERNKESIFLFDSLQSAKDYVSHVGVNGHPRRATDEEVAAGHVLNVKPYEGLASEIRQLDESQLVSLHENFESRKFAISSRASSEAEFVIEFASVFARLPDVGVNLRVVRSREFVPLVVDMCCKYRGYKAEKVFESVLLVAGDLEMPKRTLL